MNYTAELVVTNATGEYRMPHGPGGTPQWHRKYATARRAADAAARRLLKRGADQVVVRILKRVAFGELLEVVTPDSKGTSEKTAGSRPKKDAGGN
jgi:hypothetical protein